LNPEDWLFQHLNPVILDHRIAQHIAGNSVEIFARLHGDFEIFALANVLNATMAESVQRSANSLALRIEDRWLEGNVDAGFHCFQCRKSALAEQAGLQIRCRTLPLLGLLGRVEPAHQREHLHVVIMNVDQCGAFLAASSDAAAAVQIGVETRVPRAFTTPANAADFEHPYYFTVAGGAAFRLGVETRCTVPR